MKPIMLKERWALEYDGAFIEWMSNFETEKQNQTAQTIVFNEVVMTRPSISVSRVAIAVREDVEDNVT